MIQRYLGPLIVTLAIIACVIFVSCGDEGEVVKDEPSARCSQHLNLSPREPSQPAEQTPQPVEQPYRNPLNSSNHNRVVRCLSHLPSSRRSQ